MHEIIQGVVIGVAIVVVIIVILTVTGKQTAIAEKYQPYASYLANDIYRSDPAFDVPHGKREKPALRNY